MLCEIVLTVSESKRLIAKGVAAMPAVRKALADGIIAIPTGSTNAYVVEELTGTPIEKNKFTTGATLPAGVSREGLLSRELPDLVLKKGKRIKNLAAVDAVTEMSSGDVFIKGANAVHYETRRSGILIGLEKCIAHSIERAAAFITSDAECASPLPSLWPVEGEIVTEIEALKFLTGVEAIQSAAGGLAGAEGAVRLVARGTREQIAKVVELADAVHGEPPFVQSK